MITIISCGITNGAPPVGDLTFDCRTMPDPSPVVQDVSGEHPIVLEILVHDNPMVPAVLDFLVGATHKLACQKDDVSLVLVCSAGWHRSVAIADEVARRLAAHHPEGVRVIHRDLVGAS